jgi:hypothetical protein
VANDRNDKLLPRWTKSKTAVDEPKRESANRDKALPALEKDRNDKLLPR